MVYLAEDVTTTVQAGQHVTSSTVIANMFNGGDGIETGWAQPTGASAESQLPAGRGHRRRRPVPDHGRAQLRPVAPVAGGAGRVQLRPDRLRASSGRLPEHLGVTGAPARGGGIRSFLIRTQTSLRDHKHVARVPSDLVSLNDLVSPQLYGGADGAYPTQNVGCGRGSVHSPVHGHGQRDRRGDGGRRRPSSGRTMLAGTLFPRIGPPSSGRRGIQVRPGELRTGAATAEPSGGKRAGAGGQLARQRELPALPHRGPVGGAVLADRQRGQQRPPVAAQRGLPRRCGVQGQHHDLRVGHGRPGRAGVQHRAGELPAERPRRPARHQARCRFRTRSPAVWSAPWASTRPSPRRHAASATAAAAKPSQSTNPFPPAPAAFITAKPCGTYYGSTIATVKPAFGHGYPTRCPTRRAVTSPASSGRRTTSARPTPARARPWRSSTPTAPRPSPATRRSTSRRTTRATRSPTRTSPR